MCEGTDADDATRIEATSNPAFTDGSGVVDEDSFDPMELDCAPAESIRTVGTKYVQSLSIAGRNMVTESSVLAMVRRDEWRAGRQ